MYASVAIYVIWFGRTCTDTCAAGTPDPAWETTPAKSVSAAASGRDSSTAVSHHYNPDTFLIPGTGIRLASTGRDLRPTRFRLH